MSSQRSNTMTDEEYLGTDDIVEFLAESVRRKECGEPHLFDKPSDPLDGEGMGEH